MSNLFNSKIPLKVQKRNAFSQDFTNSLTTQVGTLTPCFVKQVMPGDKIKLGVNMSVELPPMASAFKGKVSANVEFFFVPWRIVYGGWRNYYLFNGGLATQYAPAGIPKVVLPVLKSPQKTLTIAKGSLADYLGIRSFKDFTDAGLTSISILPFLAYHKIWEDWYRDPQVQKPAFMEESRTAAPQEAYSLPFHLCYGQNGDQNYEIDATMYDGTPVTSLRQRNYGKDIFTNCYTTPSGGSQPMFISTLGNKFSISQLRQANALQRFAERNQIGGGRYDEVTIANYGVKPADSALNEALYLGRLVSSVYNTSVYATTNDVTDMSDISNQNPFTTSLGGRGANSSAQGGSLILKDFEAKEFGVVMGIFSLVPHATYKSGIDPIMLLGTNSSASSFADNFPIPALAGIGNEPIDAYMLTGNITNTDVFGYTDRYCWWKYSLDEVHGKLAVPSGERASLSFMQLTRNFDPSSKVQQSSSFLEIPTTAMDDITAVRSTLSEYGCIVDLFFNYTTIRPLPAYSIPSLCDDIDQATIRTIERGGKYL